METFCSGYWRWVAVLAFVLASCSDSGLGEPVDASPNDGVDDSETVAPSDVEDGSEPTDASDVPTDSTEPGDSVEDVEPEPEVMDDAVEGDGITPPPDDTVVDAVDSTPPDPPPPSVPQGAWKPMAQSNSVSLAGEKSVGYVALAMDTDERPVVAYTEKILLPAGNECPLDNRHIFLTRFNGQTWTGPDGVTSDDMQVSEVPVIETEFRYAFSPSVAVDADGNIIVAWTSALSCKMGGLQGTVMARRYVPGTGWEELGAGSTSAFGITDTNYNQASRLLIDPLGRPTVTYMSTAPGYVQGYVYVRRFENGIWNGIGGSDEFKGISGPDAEVFPEYMQEYLSLGFTPAGEPVVAWTTLVLENLLSDFSSILLRYWDGKSWEGIDGSGFSPGVVPDSGFAGQDVSTTVTADGRVHLAWSDMWTNTPLGDDPLFYASAMPSGSWAPADGGGNNGILPPSHHTSRPFLAVAFDDRPILAYVRHHGTTTSTTSDSVNVLVKYHEMEAWETLGGGDEVVPETDWRIPQLSLAGATSRVGMAWVENDPVATKAGGGLYYLEFESE